MALRFASMLLPAFCLIGCGATEDEPPCSVRAVTISPSMTVTVGQARRTLLSFRPVAAVTDGPTGCCPRELDNSRDGALFAVFEDAGNGPAQDLVVPLVDDTSTPLTLALTLPVGRGDVVSITGSTGYAGIGLKPAGKASTTGGPAAITFAELDIGQEVSGTVTIVETTPLSIHVDASAKDPTGKTATADGDVATSVDVVRSACVKPQM